MSTKRRRVVCDGCGSTGGMYLPFVVRGAGLRALRRTLQDGGWIRRDYLDLCPMCRSMKTPTP